MSLQSPEVAYTAASNVEAHQLIEVLGAAGIEAAAVDDVSQVGVWMGGLASQMHRPQVWVDRTDLERARAVLQKFEEQRQARRTAIELSPPIKVVCEKCGREAEFPAVQSGTVQDCPHCYGYVDVGDDVGFDDWNVPPDGAATVKIDD